MSSAANLTSKEFSFILLKTKLSLTFNCPYTGLIYGCSPIPTASPPILPIWQRGPQHPTLPQGAFLTAGVHQHTPQLWQQPSLAQPTLGSNAARRNSWPQPRPSRLWARTEDSSLETWGGLWHQRVLCKYSTQHANPANRVTFSTISVDLWDVTQTSAVLLCYQQPTPLNDCKQIELKVLLQNH